MDESYKKQYPFNFVENGLGWKNYSPKISGTPLENEVVTQAQLVLIVKRLLENIQFRFVEKNELKSLEEKIEQQSIFSERLIDYLDSKSQILNISEHFVQDSQEVDEGEIIVEEIDVVDYKLDMVIGTLSDPKWQFRTVQGIKKDTGLSENEVETILNDNKGVIRKAVVPNRKGKSLYTLRSHPIRIRERFAEFCFYLNKYYN